MIGALIATMLANLVAFGIEIDHLGIVNDLDRGEDLSFETVDASDQRVLAGLGLQTLAYVTAGVLFLAWFHRAYGNLPRLGAWPLRYDSGWAVGAWFIPLFNLVRPKQLTDDVWRGSEPRPGPKRLDEHPRVPAVIHLWWAVCCLAWLVASVERLLGSEAQTLPEQRTSVVVTLAACGVYVLAAALAIVVVRKVSRRQDAAIRVILETGPPFPPPVQGWGQLAPAYGWGQATPAPAWGPPPPRARPPGPEAPGGPLPPPP